MTSTDCLLIALIVLEASNIAQAHFLHKKLDSILSDLFTMTDEMLEELLGVVRGEKK